MASASEAELLIVVDNLLEFIHKNVTLVTVSLPFHGVESLRIKLKKLKDWIKDRRGKLEKLFISSIKELVHEAEEAIETCVVQELMIRRKTQMQRSITWLKEDLREWLDNVLIKLEVLNDNFRRLDSQLLRISNKNDQRWNDKALFVVEDYKQTVGRREETEKVVKLVDKIYNAGDSNLEVISITGMVGLGKTTLARRVFKDGAVECLFSLRAFVSVPQDYTKNKKMVYIEILRQFGEEEKISSMEETELFKMLGDFLNSSSFLIVLDDVGSPEVLVDVRRSMAMAAAAAAAQQHGNRQSESKVVLLIITRGRKSAMEIGYSENYHNLDLRLLETEESKELLRMETFGKNECPEGLEECETKIVEKCYGLPLAIVSFARILAKRRNKIEWWKKVADYVNVFTEESQVNKAIRSVYDELNGNLKLCFLYLGVFERGAEIPVWVLLRLWMAEGLVRKMEEEDGLERIWTEEIAENYLEELVERNLVMVSQRRSNGKIRAIEVHDGVLDFCISEAKEENLFKESLFSETSQRFCIRDPVIVSKQFYGWKPTAKSIPLRSILYISDNQMNTIFIHTNYKPKSLRGLVYKVVRPLMRPRLSRLSDRELFSLFLSSFVPKTFTLLRVLDAGSFELTNLPAQLFSLFLLRYMAISCNSSFLPKELSNLCYLETLIVETSSESETLEIRADLRDMELLRHIHSNKSILVSKKYSTYSRNRNENLRTISRISPRSCTPEFFKGTPNLKKLVISGNLGRGIKTGGGSHKQRQQDFHFFRYLSGLESLENLKLLNEYESRFKYPLPLESHDFPMHLMLGNWTGTRWITRQVKRK